MKEIKAASGLKYEAVVEYLTNAIRHGVYSDGGHIPSERTLSETLGVSITTIRLGLDKLCNSGLIRKRQGSRGIVCASALQPRPTRALNLGWIAQSGYDQMNPVLGESYLRVMRRLDEMNCHLTYLPCRSVRDEADLLKMFPSFDGFFLAGIRTFQISTELAHQLILMKTVVEIDDVGLSPAVCMIGTDDYLAGRMMSDYLKKEHRRKVAVFISDSSTWYPAFATRNRGIIDGLKANQTPFELVRCSESALHTTEFNESLAKLLSDNPLLDTVWFASDANAIQIRRKMENLGLKRILPLRSCGVDGLPLLDIPLQPLAYSFMGALPTKQTPKKDPKHASILHPFSAIAEKAIATMLKLIDGKEPVEPVQKIPPTLIPWA